MTKYTKYVWMLFFCFFYGSIQSQTYDRAKAIAYADKWWSGFNTNNNPPEDGGPYRNYSDDGGDCAAFVSQCLRAGGLDLSKGTNGLGNGVKKDNVIAGVKELILHLQKYQIIEYELIKGGAGQQEPEFVGIGDPVFIGSNTPVHSIFCAAVEKGKNVYNSHSNPAYHMPRKYWIGSSETYCFHIGKYTPTYPSHCSNCRHDEDETGIDCGGSCPPCEDAPENRSITNSNITSTNYALGDINTVGAVTIASGQKVQFTAGNSILLDAGFSIQTGAEFIAQATTDKSKITRSFRKSCIFTPNVFTPNNDGINDFYSVELSGILYIDILISDINGKEKFRTQTSVSADGLVKLWDGRHNGREQPTGGYYYIMDATDYAGNVEQRTGIITLLR